MELLDLILKEMGIVKKGKFKNDFFEITGKYFPYYCYNCDWIYFEKRHWFITHLVKMCQNLLQMWLCLVRYSIQS